MKQRTGKTLAGKDVECEEAEIYKYDTRVKAWVRGSDKYTEEISVMEGVNEMG